MLGFGFSFGASRLPGGDMAIIPRPRISDTRQQIEVSGTNYLRVSDKLRLTRVGGPPDPPRKVAPDGISPLFLAVGQPTINEQRILPEGIYVAQQFGTCTLRTPSAIAQGFNATEIGVHSVSMRHRRIEVEGIDATVAVGRPVLSPHTIWAVVEAPEQAKRNHNATSLHYVGEDQIRKIRRKITQPAAGLDGLESGIAFASSPEVAKP